MLVIDTDLFDELAADFVDRNDEGQVVAERYPFTEAGVRGRGVSHPPGPGALSWRGCGVNIC